MRTTEQKRENNRKTRERRAANPEKSRAYGAKYRAANREKILAYGKEYYVANREKCCARTKKYRVANPIQEKLSRQKVREKREKLRRKFDLLKLDRPCYDCGEVFTPVSMDWDHVDPATKKFTISAGLLIGCRPIEEIIDEINKCQLVCSNCHRIRTANRRAA